MENQHKMISGYRDLNLGEINAINDIKQAEIAIGELWKSVGDHEGNDFTVDMQWMAIAKTHFEEGFSAFVRAVAKPEARF